MKASKFIFTGLITLGLLVSSAAASAAPGVVIDKSKLPAAARASLEREIAKAKAQNPKLFAQVAKSPELAKEADEQKRARHGSIARPLEALGKAAVPAMLEMIAIDGPPRGDLSQGAWFTLRVSLLEAVGRLKDSRSRPTLMAIVKTSNEYEIVRTAAEALGRLGDDASAKFLATQVKRGGTKQLAILNGAGECRRTAMVDALSEIVAKRSPDAALNLSLIRALGAVGNAWAWQTDEVKKTGEGPRVRATAAKALMALFVSSDGELREKAAKAILVVDDPSTPTLIEAAKRGADQRLVEALDRLAARVAYNPTR